MTDGLPRFAVDRSLERLAGWLRWLGFDAVCLRHLDRQGIETLACREGRLLLTRSPPTQRAPQRAGTLVLASADFRGQLREIDRVHPLGGWQERPPRCPSCNVRLPGPDRGRLHCSRCRSESGGGGVAARREAEMVALSLRAPDRL